MPSRMIARMKRMCVPMATEREMTELMARKLDVIVKLLEDELTMHNYLGNVLAPVFADPSKMTTETTETIRHTLQRAIDRMRAAADKVRTEGVCSIDEALELAREFGQLITRTSSFYTDAEQAVSSTPQQPVARPIKQ